MPIVVNYGDVEALGQLALAAGESLGTANRMNRDALRADRELQMLMQAQYQRWGQEQQMRHQAGIADTRLQAQMDLERLQGGQRAQLAAQEQEALLQREYARAAAQAASREDTQAHAFELEQARQAGREQLQGMRGEAAIEQIRARETGDAAPGEKQVQERLRKFNEFDTQILVPKYLSGPNGNPEVYKQKAEEAKAFFLGSGDLPMSALAGPKPKEYEPTAPAMTSQEARTMGALIQGGQYQMLQAVVDATPKHKRQQLLADMTGASLRAFQEMPLQALSAQLADQQIRASMPPEVLRMAELVVQQRQAAPYEAGGYAPSNQPSAPGPQQGLQNYSDDQLIQDIRARGLSEEEIRRRYPGLLP